MVKVGFHYMSESRWNELIQDSHKIKSIKPGMRLIRLRSITDLDIPKLPAWAHDGYIFAFPDKEAPEPWKSYTHGEEEWDALTREIGSRIVAVRFDILPTDKAYVVDRAHFADFQYWHSRDRQEAIRRYALSRVPAKRYDGSFRMPELIIKNPIRLERLVLHDAFEREVICYNGEYTVSYYPCQVK
jgi:hypothetical protein